MYQTADMVEQHTFYIEDNTKICTKIRFEFGLALKYAVTGTSSDVIRKCNEVRIVVITTTP